MSTNKRQIYLATAQAFDDEMGAKISRHQSDRGTNWVTIETPLDPASALEKLSSNDVVLLDCATLWLSNHLLAENNIELETEKLMAGLQNCEARVVVVSNEAGQGIVPENALARQFRDHQGKLNQQIAQQADLVVAVMAGLPLMLKGALPMALT